MRPKGSSPRSQNPATLHYHEPDKSRSRLPNDFFKNNINTILPPTSRFSRLLFPASFLTKTLYAALLPPHVLPDRHLLIVDLITRIIFGEEYRS